ncbi:MAG TPA: sigma-54-dependent Fis family transcriptional regulator [Clostridiales bacterium]|nr:sigma-54-dependent Fis family transcriptional regulator [Clostridiales bacterium]
MNKSILIVDDEEIIRMSLGEGLKDMGYRVSTAANGAEAEDKVRKDKPVAVFLDMRLSGENGLDVLEKIKKAENEAEVIIMTAYGETQSAVRAIKMGAFDYINKPFDLQEIDLIIKKAIKNAEMQKKLYIYEKEKQSLNSELMGDHPLMKAVKRDIDILAKNDEVTALIKGESGTGKEIVATAIHGNSIRKNSPMLKINCGSIPKQLLESEMFGFEKNAFTGANERKKGLMEVADGGTVFLDEIGEMPIELQPKLLRFIEERKFKRVGGLEDIEVDIRIIAATNKNLEEAILKKEFREDLYYRLNVVPVVLPPLRERGDDILILTDKFLEDYNLKFHKKIKGFTKNAKDVLMGYTWRGNVRELKNIVERIVLLTEEEYIDVDDLPFEIRQNEYGIGNEHVEEFTAVTGVIEKGFSLEKQIEKMEIYYMTQALKKCGNNYSKASEMLGITRFSFKRRVEKYFQ